MRKAFTHLDFHARDRIEALYKSGHSQVEISLILGVHKSTVSREIQCRKKEDGEYKADMAEHKAGVKRSNSKHQGMKIENNPFLRKHIIAEMKVYRSPDEIAGVMKKEKWPIRVSADAIYSSLAISWRVISQGN